MGGSVLSCTVRHIAGSDNWNAPPDSEHANERTGLMMGGQASAFSVACRVFAPKYRQASIAAYGLTAKPGGGALCAPQSHPIRWVAWSLLTNVGLCLFCFADAERVFGTAYFDVAAAFRHYLAFHNQGRPFILASHSQGGHHMHRLLEEELEGNWAALGSRK